MGGRTTDGFAATVSKDCAISIADRGSGGSSGAVSKGGGITGSGSGAGVSSGAITEGGAITGFRGGARGAAGWIIKGCAVTIGRSTAKLPREEIATGAIFLRFIRSLNADFGAGHGGAEEQAAEDRRADCLQGWSRKFPGTHGSYFLIKDGWRLVVMAMERLCVG